jgi:hypothetical protein
MNQENRQCPEGCPETESCARKTKEAWTAVEKKGVTKWKAFRCFFKVGT